MNGGAGRDRIRASNDPAREDAVDCGGGFDRVVVDNQDVVDNCERVLRP